MEQKYTYGLVSGREAERIGGRKLIQPASQAGFYRLEAGALGISSLIRLPMILATGVDGRAHFPAGKLPDDPIACVNPAFCRFPQWRVLGHRLPGFRSDHSELVASL